MNLTLGKRYLLMLTSKGEVWALGSNENNPFNQEATYLSVPTLIYQDIKAISSGWAHVVLLTHTGKVLSYGRNNLKQLGR